jgi:hypothetical protein
MTPKPHILKHWQQGERRVKDAAKYAVDVMKYHAILPGRLKTKCFERWQWI